MIHAPLTPELIETSIARSLSRLATDHVDVFALHAPAVQDVTRDDVLRALEAVLRRGQARYLAVAGDLSAGLAAAAGGRFAVIQLADDPRGDSLDQVRAAAKAPVATISHSVFGVGGAREVLAAHLASDAALRDQAAAAGFDGPPAQTAAELLLARAFAANPQGVVLASMFGPGHLAANVAAASRPLDERVLAIVAAGLTA